MATWWSTGSDYLQRIWRYRYFWWSLVRNDLRTRYRRSFLGIGWSLARPLALTVVFCVVFGRLFDIPREQYAPFLLVGMTLWQLILEATLQGCNCFIIGGPYIKQQQLPLAIFPLRCVLGGGIHCLLALGLAIAIAWFFNPRMNLLLALFGSIPGLLVLFLVCVFLAILCGVLHTHFPDTQNLLEILLQILFYLTPVLYPPHALSQRGRLSWLVELNPFTSVLELVRAPILGGTLPSLWRLQIALLLLLATGALAAVCLRKLERTLVFWV
jgi:ABC-type polysaccharide/polyol phosphate export permease